MRVFAFSVFASLAATSFDANAQIVRRRFDPEDLKLEDPGVVHADMAFGVVRGVMAGRWLLPDFDVDFGLTSNVELGIDGAFTREGTPGALYSFDHSAPDNLWFSSKVGLWESRDAAHKTAWAAGIQLGPRVAMAPDARGAGFQGLALLGRTVRRTHLVFNVGGLVDPGAAIARERPTALLVGVDATIDLDEKGTWSIAADLSAMVFTSADANQLASTAGIVWSVTPRLDLGISGLVGFLSGGDRYGAMLNVSPKILVF